MPRKSSHLAHPHVWRRIMREFAEEFFGREDLSELRAALVDLEVARSSAYCLGRRAPVTPESVT